MKTSEFSYHLPEDRIAQTPLEKRDASRLLVLNRESRSWDHRAFLELPGILRPDDLLVVNNSRVIPARLFALKQETGGEVELLLHKEREANAWVCMTRPAKRLRQGTHLRLYDNQMKLTEHHAEIVECLDEGQRLVRFDVPGDIRTLLDHLGRMPLPPYIEREKNARPEDWQRYQTVYSNPAGSVAAPTAGLHFTPELLSSLEAKGIHSAPVTLHVGLGTFQPVKADDVQEHQMHEETYEIVPETADAILKAKSEGRRVVAVGTTSLRTLETQFRKYGRLQPGRGSSRLFVYPPAEFGVVDALITNFHLPESTLLMLVAAFASPGLKEGVQLIKDAYQSAIDQDYRFFSYGDAMLIQ